MTQPVPPSEAAIESGMTGDVGLGLNPIEVLTLELPFPAGKKVNIWAVFARVVLLNGDGDAQSARALLYVQGSLTAPGVPGTLVDEVDVRIPGSHGDLLGACVSLQSVIRRTDPVGGTPLHSMMRLFCSGFDCTATQGSLIGLDLGYTLS